MIAIMRERAISEGLWVFGIHGHLSQISGMADDEAVECGEVIIRGHFFDLQASP
jgi:hypothetical protein